jgi:hypothetical protein
MQKPAWNPVKAHFREGMRSRAPRFPLSAFSYSTGRWMAAQMVRCGNI